ncbi:MAG: branched-chain amino acid ABC transporter permease [Pseudobutyrivibrio sp.]|uniref:branched-chain amino acid ABC transporter permease n=1 Tax=Pseudobutyrivibrio ruminis TaxID=46206 RepID=UPI0004840C8F|nr:branched-chain amino acid ABC transporter permease [Pseudobutyrivibrio ruminis]MBP5324868.1 branched-chain amino acid ABC transporter permease [Pseudobutyrivibrio sp.]MDC7280131.1 branched-chain amino acid ABC transporter permease [Butyrivibrio fibrisolvens]
MKVKEKRNLILSIAAVLLCCLYLFILESDSVAHSYAITIIERSCIYAVAAVSMNLIIGFTGQFSLGTAGFMCIGAYITGVLTIPVEMRDQIFYLYGMASWLHDIKLPLIVTLILCAVVCAGIAALIGWPVLRLKSDYLAIATLGFSEIIRAIFGWDGLGKITNASYGVSNIPEFKSIFECVIISAVCIVIMILLVNSSYGRAFKAIRDDDVAAEAMGINLFRTKQLSFVVSSAFAGVAGGLLAVYMRSAVTSTFTVALTYNILLMVVLGGIGSISGSILGAFIVTGSQEWLRFLDREYTWSELIPGIGNTGFGAMNVPLLRNGFRMVVFSLLLMLVVLFWNHGLTGSKEITWDRLINGAKKLMRSKKEKAVSEAE